MTLSEEKRALIEASEELLEFCKDKDNWRYGPDFYWDFLIEDSEETLRDFFNSFWNAPRLAGPFLEWTLEDPCKFEELELPWYRSYGLLELESGVQTAFSLSKTRLLRETPEFTKFRVTFKPAFMERVATRMMWNLCDDFGADPEALAFHHAFIEVLKAVPALCAYAGDQAWCWCVCSFWPDWRDHLVVQQSFQSEGTTVNDVFRAIELSAL